MPISMSRDGLLDRVLARRVSRLLPNPSADRSAPASDRDA